MGSLKIKVYLLMAINITSLTAYPITGTRSESVWREDQTKPVRECSIYHMYSLMSRSRTHSRVKEEKQKDTKNCH